MLSYLTPNYSWDAAAGQYRNIATGQFVPRAAVVEALKTYRDARALDAEGLAEKLQNGQLTLAQWQLEMEGMIADVQLASACAAKGGWAQMSPADFGRVGQRCQFHYAKLAQFAAQIEAGDLALDGNFINRCRLYGLSGYATYWRQSSADMLVKGADKVRSVRGKNDSCVGCLHEESRGWVDVGSEVFPGERDCCGHCGCTLAYRNSATGVVYGV